MTFIEHMNQKRVEILKKLKKGPKNIGSLYWDVEITWHNCHYHLTRLLDLGLVKAKHTQSTTLYSLSDKGYEAIAMFEE
jgi:predicted transcriptional regulator